MSRLQLLLVGAALVLGVSIFLFGEMTVLKPNETKTAVQEQSMDAEALLLISRSSLSTQEQDKLTTIEKALDTVNNPSQREALARSMAAFWETKNDWGAAAVWYERSAEAGKDANGHALAGTRFLAAADMVGDSVLLSYLHTSSIRNFEAASTLAPENLDIAADLGHALTIGTAAPMQGIQKLLGIVQQEPKHLKANFHLAQLAIRSEQYDKAVKRFNDILSWYPSFADAYLGLGEAYYKLGDKPKAIQALEDYKALSKDPAILAQVEAFLTQIKSSTP